MTSSLDTLTALASRVADDLDRLPAVPAVWVRANFYMDNGRHEGLNAQAWAEEWDRFPAELGAAQDAAAYLRSLPALAARAEALDEDGRADLEPSDEITSLLRQTLFVDADVIAYRRFDEAEDVRRGQSPRAAAYYVSWAWESFLAADEEGMQASLAQALTLLDTRGAE